MLSRKEAVEEVRVREGRKKIHRGFCPMWFIVALLFLAELGGAIPHSVLLRQATVVCSHVTEYSSMYGGKWEEVDDAGGKLWRKGNN